MPTTSASWKASLPIRWVATWPVMQTIGVESIKAFVSPVTQLVAPGPEVTMTTPTLPVERAYPSAACIAPCSWRTRTWLSRSRACASSS